MHFKFSPTITLGTKAGVEMCLLPPNDTQYLPPDVWKKMTRDERSAHIAKSRKARATKRNREVQAANTENNTDNATDAETGTTSNTESNAGSQFGSNAYANKRQKAS